MVIVGAKGHAKEILDLVEKRRMNSEILFFDNVSSGLPDKLYGIYPILKSESEVLEAFNNDPEYILGVGGCFIRRKLSLMFTKLGGKLTSIVANSANIGNHNVKLGAGINIMHGVSVSNDVYIGKGTLVNSNSTIHHDVTIGNFCEISPGVTLTGGVSIGNLSSIGAGAIILPKLCIGNNVIIGAGAVVTKHIMNNSVAVGIPARHIKNNIF